MINLAWFVFRWAVFLAAGYFGTAAISQAIGFNADNVRWVIMMPALVAPYIPIQFQVFSVYPVWIVGTLGIALLTRAIWYNLLDFTDMYNDFIYARMASLIDKVMVILAIYLILRWNLITMLFGARFGDQADVVMLGIIILMVSSAAFAGYVGLNNTPQQLWEPGSFAGVSALACALMVSTQFFNLLSPELLILCVLLTIGSFLEGHLAGEPEKRRQRAAREAALRAQAEQGIAAAQQQTAAANARVASAQAALGGGGAPARGR